MIPQRTTEQRQEAARSAAQARAKRAQIKRDLKSGELTLTQALDLVGTDATVAAMRVKELIGALPAMGPARTTKLMKELRIADTKRLGGLGHLQCEALARYASTRDQLGGPK